MQLILGNAQARAGVERADEALAGCCTILKSGNGLSMANSAMPLTEANVLRCDRQGGVARCQRGSNSSVGSPHRHVGVNGLARAQIGVGAVNVGSQSDSHSKGARADIARCFHPP